MQCQPLNRTARFICVSIAVGSAMAWASVAGAQGNAMEQCRSKSLSLDNMGGLLEHRNCCKLHTGPPS